MALFYRPPEPVQAVPKVLPRTPGSEPPRSSPLGGSSGVLAAVGMWAAAAAVPMPVQKPLNVVALTLTYGQQPPRSGQLTGANDAAEMVATLANWPQPGEPRPTQQQIVGVQIAPLTLRYGSQPPAAAPNTAAVAQWSSSWSAQSAAPNAAWNVPAIVSAQPYRPYPVATWDSSFQFPQRLVGIAPLTLVYGQQPGVPPRTYQYDMPQWPAQSAAPNAGWNVPAIVSSYIPPVQRLASWDALTWPAQSEADSAGWNFVPPVVNVPPPRVVPPIVAVFAWQPPPPLPTRPVAIVPLTLRYGSQPPPGPAIPVAVAITINQQWPAVWWPAQMAAPVAPLTLVYGQRPPIVGVRVPHAALLPWYLDWGTQRYPPIAAELQAFVGVPPQPGINRVVFDASTTLVVFDTNVTRIVFDANGTVIVFDAFTTAIIADSLITRSVFDG